MANPHRNACDTAPLASLRSFSIGHTWGKNLGVGLLFALAVAIKLTALVLIVPLIAWRD
ncbi:MAG: hypothetical protein ACLPY1_24570 [Terracidiphilus sp.]